MLEREGKTPVLDGDEAKKLIDSIDVSTIVGLPDRALIALLAYLPAARAAHNRSQFLIP